MTISKAFSFFTLILPTASYFAFKLFHAFPAEMIMMCAAVNVVLPRLSEESYTVKNAWGTWVMTHSI